MIPSGNPISVELGPGLCGQLFDGIQRPLNLIKSKTESIFISKGTLYPSVCRAKEWLFKPLARIDQTIGPGDLIGSVQENDAVTISIIVPPDLAFGKIVFISDEGMYTVQDLIAQIECEKSVFPLYLMHTWPIRKPRPVLEKLAPQYPFITGLRVFDGIFPAVFGGTIAIPGAFGCGKTSISQSLSKNSKSDLTIYVGCGERGNEMAEILNEFPSLTIGNVSRHKQCSVIDKTILIANTSNMPVAAREASIYTGITIAEYYRDQGLNVSMMADSTSRWAEALREISGRLAELPADNGYPAYLGARIASFYERSGRISCLQTSTKNNIRYGSLTLFGSISPPGGDFTDPVTSASLSVTQVFWGLDKKLAYIKHFPSVNWKTSYSNYTDILDCYYTTNYSDYSSLRKKFLLILQRDSELVETVQLVGRASLSEVDKLYLDISKLIKEQFLQQNIFSKYDEYCPWVKTYWMMKNIIYFCEFAITYLEKFQKRWYALKELVTELFTGLTKMKYINNIEEEQNDLMTFHSFIKRKFADLGIHV